MDALYRLWWHPSVTRELVRRRGHEQRAAERAQEIRGVGTRNDCDRRPCRLRLAGSVDPDERGSRTRSHDQRGRCHGLQGTKRGGAPARQDERERRRPFESGRPHCCGDLLGALRESAAGGAAAEMRAQQRRLELGELTVGAQRRPFPGALAQLRSGGHTGNGDAAGARRLVHIRDKRNRVLARTANSAYPRRHPWR